ncbi:MAG TPA: NAD-dependent epimerase/dehydratase family protein [Polyangia bacterium]|jgi:2'-hydroxyisoflavone reductase
MPVRRREFLAALAAAAVGCATSSSSRSSSSSQTRAAVKPKRILILGGTGFVGPAIVNAARARGHTLTLFNRGKTAPGMFPDIETIIGNRATGNLEGLRGHEWDAVIDTWVMMPKSVHAAASLLKDHVGQYLFVSTISVYKLGKEPIDESSPVLSPKTVNATKLEGVEDYGGNKALAEREAEEIMPGRATSLRSGVIVGPGDPSDRFIYWPLRFRRGGEVLAPGTPDDRMQLIDVRDLGGFIIHCIEDKIVGTYNTVGPDDPALGHILDAVKTATKSDARVTFADSAFLEAEKAGGWSDFPLAVGNNDDQAGFGHVNAQKAIARGLKFRSPVESARDALAWYDAQPEARRQKPRPGLTPEREAELLAKWHAAHG